MKQKKRVEKKMMPVKDGGMAWIQRVRWAKRHPHRMSYMERDADGQIRRKHLVHFIKGIVTGGCPECKQMPCQHTAKLLGWPQNDS